jgi:hypothetical protein
MSNDRQRHANGERSKDQFTIDVTNELNRLEAEIKRQARCLVPARIVVTQQSVAEATDHHRTTFRGNYHKPLRDRITELRKQAKDPKGVHIHRVEKAKVARVTEDSKAKAHPRIDALQEANKRLANENRMLRRELYQQRSSENGTPGAAL